MPSPIMDLELTGRRVTADPLVPRLISRDPRVKATLLRAYQQAYRWARAAHRWLVRLASGHGARARWNNSPASRVFGPYAPHRARHVAQVFRGLIRRFRRGYEIGGRRRPPTLACFPKSYGRCRTGLLGNASIFGTVRVCPQLFARGPSEVAAVVLHELMHQDLGVDDQRHGICTGSKNRCYREGAIDLLRAGRFDLAVHNIDNFVRFARSVPHGG